MEQDKPSAPSGDHASGTSAYTAVPSEWAGDTRLSFEALGVLAHMVSYPPGSAFTVESLTAASDVDDEATVRSAVDNLQEAGYLRPAASGWAVAEHPRLAR